MSEIEKALDLTSSTRTVFEPEVVDGETRDYVAKQPLLYNAFAHKPWATTTYYIRKRTAIPTAAWRADGGILPSADNQTFTRVEKSVKYLYARGEVTGPMVKAVGSVMDALADEVQAHAEGMYEKLSTDLVTATGASDAIEGVIHQIDTDADMNAGGGTLDVALADTAGTGPLELDLDLLDEAIDLTKGSADIILINEKVRRRVNGLLRSAQRFNDTVEVQAGFRVRSYDGIPMVSVPQWSSDDDILLLRRADAKVLIHQDVTFEELAKVKDSTDFMLKAYVGFALEGRPVHLTGFTIDGSGE